MSSLVVLVIIVIRLDQVVLGTQSKGYALISDNLNYYTENKESGAMIDPCAHCRLDDFEKETVSLKGYDRRKRSVSDIMRSSEVLAMLESDPLLRRFLQDLWRRRQSASCNEYASFVIKNINQVCNYVSPLRQRNL